MSFRAMDGIAVVLLVSGCLAIASTPAAWGQQEIGRKVKSKVAATYPELARRMNITGVVRVEVTVAPNGTVKSVKLVGGHPVLANAAMESVKKWRYEAAAGETTGVVEFHFDPNQ